MSVSKIRTKVVEDLRGRDIESADELINVNMFSDTVVRLPKRVLERAQDFVHEAFRLRKTLPPPAEIAGATTLGNFDPGNHSILMSYDFHVVPPDSIKLIEINTNSAFLAMSDVMYRAAGLPSPVEGFSFDEIRESILEELRLFGRPVASPRVAIIDENPPAQRLYVEFLLYQKIFQSWGWPCEILDVAEDLSKFDFIYNRSTDFYFEHEKSRQLRDLYLSKRVCVSPNPHEYFLLADKRRLNDWSRAVTNPKIREGLLESVEVTDANADEIWARRKGLFFKPVHSFGSKSSFKGASISHKVFHDIRIESPILAQEYCHAPEIEIGGQKFKYDLRFYAYQGKVQSVVARIYQGQVTNLKTPGGGFAPVVFG